jgi:hypothetical protein
MNEVKFIGSPLRMQALQKLKVFLGNPGKFCLIVLGSRGSGKHFAIETAYNEIFQNADKDLCLEDLKFIEPYDLPVEADALNELFKEWEHKTLVVEDVEELTDEQQKLLFKALSTTDGTFGIGKSINLRIVFTSSKSADALRTDKNLILGLFWDRISQLIVELPSYKKDDENIRQDFYSTWNKMSFEKAKGYKHLSGTPKNLTLEKFLEDHAEKFEGGFRDLDKIACLYFNYRIFHYGSQKKIIDEIEKKVVASVIDDFFSKSQMQGSSDNDESVYQFQVGLTHQELLGRYKMQLRRWAVKEYGGLGIAEKKLGFKPGSMKNYVETKVTTKHKASEAKPKQK